MASAEDSSSQKFLTVQMYNLVWIVFVNTKLMALRLASLFSQLTGNFLIFLFLVLIPYSQRIWKLGN